MRRLVSLFLAGAALSAMPALAQTGTNASCSALGGLKLENVRITTAEHVVPGWAPPKSLFNWGDSRAKTSFCRVVLTVDKEIRTEVWLPDIWNGRFEGVGNAALTGDLNYPSMAQAVTSGFALMPVSNCDRLVRPVVFAALLARSGLSNGQTKARVSMHTAPAVAYAQ